VPIRLAGPADIPTMMALERHAATAAHWSAEQYQSAFSAKAASRVALILEQDAVVQGFITGRALGEEWEIENIAVAGPARRRGFGRRLLAEFLDLARSRHANKVFLEVRESNLAARRLYEKERFLENGRRKLYYHQPEEDAIVYQIEFA
jgi:ribosomal-protein-alanine N-acetyltransferase